MNIALIAQSATAALASCLPYLLKMGDKAAEEAAKKVGGDAWEHAKSLWSKLSMKIEATPSAREAVADIAKTPDDEDARTILRVQIKKLLTENPHLAREVQELVTKAPRGDVKLVVSGERAVGVAGDMKGGMIITGDGHKPR